MQQDWSLQSRGHHCTTTERPFAEGENFYTLLFDETTGYRREDLCEEAYKARPADAPEPFSFWRSKYSPPPPPAPEALAKNTAEDLLRAYMLESSPQHASARYLLAVMLERKRILKEVETKRAADGTLIRVYEHGKSGEVFVIPDPELKLDEIETVQMEVASLLSPSAPGPAVDNVESKPPSEEPSPPGPELSPLPVEQ
ncbi:MAG TPA: hypothetical protein VFG14_03270 [Chthoniobacteraceae bacterium]|nr:hypothetical protein [Chthoniobacteraceae bacterium]